MEENGHGEVRRPIQESGSLALWLEGKNTCRCRADTAVVSQMHMSRPSTCHFQCLGVVWFVCISAQVFNAACVSCHCEGKRSCRCTTSCHALNEETPLLHARQPRPSEQSQMNRNSGKLKTGNHKQLTNSSNLHRDDVLNKQERAVVPAKLVKDNNNRHLLLHICRR